MYSPLIIYMYMYFWVHSQHNCYNRPMALEGIWHIVKVLVPVLLGIIQCFMCMNMYCTVLYYMQIWENPTFCRFHQNWDFAWLYKFAMYNCTVSELQCFVMQLLLILPIWNVVKLHMRILKIDQNCWIFTDPVTIAVYTYSLIWTLRCICSDNVRKFQLHAFSRKS